MPNPTLHLTPGLPTTLLDGRRRSRVSHEYLLWIAVAAYGLHILEEFELNWRDWARVVLGLPVEWGSFYVVNALVIVLGVCCASVGWREPWFALGFPALMVINATLFHVLPVVVTRVYSPGVTTAVVLFYPAAGWVYYGAWADGALTTTAGVLSGAFGVGLMAMPVILLKVKGSRLFDYRGTKHADRGAGPDRGRT
jgi:hypothetical protein